MLVSKPHAVADRQQRAQNDTARSESPCIMVFSDLFFYAECRNFIVLIQ
jgi:hypothetical protein